MCRGTGYRGRIGIFELLVMTDELKDAITHKQSRGTLKQLAADGVLVPLRADGWLKVRSGLTTVEEVLRVVHE